MEPGSVKPVVTDDVNTALFAVIAIVSPETNGFFANGCLYTNCKDVGWVPGLRLALPRFMVGAARMLNNAVADPVSPPVLPLFAVAVSVTSPVDGRAAKLEEIVMVAGFVRPTICPPKSVPITTVPAPFTTQLENVGAPVAETVTVGEA